MSVDIFQFHILRYSYTQEEQSEPNPSSVVFCFPSSFGMGFLGDSPQRPNRLLLRNIHAYQLAM